MNVEVTHNIDKMFSLGKLEPMLHEVMAPECRMNIRVVDEISSENGPIRIKREFDLIEEQLVDNDIWIELMQLAQDPHSGFKNMFLYTRENGITQYRLEFIFEE